MCLCWRRRHSAPAATPRWLPFTDAWRRFESLRERAHIQRILSKIHKTSSYVQFIFFCVCGGGGNSSEIHQDRYAQIQTNLTRACTKMHSSFPLDCVPAAAGCCSFIFPFTARPLFPRPRRPASLGAAVRSATGVIMIAIVFRTACLRPRRERRSRVAAGNGTAVWRMWRRPAHPTHTHTLPLGSVLSAALKGQLPLSMGLFPLSPRRKLC